MPIISEKINISSEVIVGDSMIIYNDRIVHVDVVQPIIQVNVVENQIEMPQKMKLKELEIENSGLRSHGRGVFKGTDVEIEDSNRGLILTAQSGGKWLLWIDNNGSVFTTQVAASPEISFEERVIKIEKQQAVTNTLKAEAGLLAKDDVQGRLDNVEKLLGVIIK